MIKGKLKTQPVFYAITRWKNQSNSRKTNADWLVGEHKIYWKGEERELPFYAPECMTSISTDESFLEKISRAADLMEKFNEENSDEDECDQAMVEL